MTERTLCVVKPNAVKKNKVGAIVAMLEEAGLTVVGMKMARVTERMIEGFYEEHLGKPFFPSLKDFMTSGKVVAMVLEGENAIARCREIMGATNPEKAVDGTIRKLYADSMTENAVHGSDSPESAAREIAFYFDNFSLL